MVNGRAIRFTTENPDSYVSPLKVSNDNQIPKSFSVVDVYPNPFNPLVNFNLQVAESKSYNLEVFDMMGRLIKNIHNGILVPGNYTFSWDGRLNNSSQASSGAYFLVVSNDASSSVNKMLLLK